MKLYFTVLFLAVAGLLSGQNLLSSRQSGYYTYIFSITDDEALEIYTSGDTRWMDRKTLFHTLIDSIPLHSGYSDGLKPGHYLQVSAIQKDLKISVSSVPNVNVQVFNNNTDLNLQVFDTTGLLITSARVIADGKRLRFDNSIKGYSLSKTNRKGVLEVRYDGMSSFFELTKDYNIRAARRVASRILYGTPLKYVFVPLKFLIAAPVITIRDLVHRNAYAIGNDLRYFWVRHGFTRRNNPVEKGNGYFVFNKPKYFPCDTVRFKAFIVGRNGKPIDKELRLQLSERWGKERDLGKIKPAGPGNYNNWFILADTLDLGLDRQLELSLINNNNTKYISGYFRYEDYELKNINLSVRLDSSVQISGRNFRIFVRATDENGLNIQDGRIELILKSKDLIRQYSSDLYLKDTLYVLKTPLNQKGETIIPVPDTLFPAADITYSLIVRVLRSDNEDKTFNRDVSWFYQIEDVRYELSGDMITFTATKNGKPCFASATISGRDKFGYSSVPANVSLPYTEKINPYFSSYSVTAGLLTKTIEIDQGMSLITCSSSIKDDTLSVTVLNPRGLPFVWFLYKGDKPESRGYGNSFSCKRDISARKKYLLTIAYLWSGTTINKSFDLSGDKNNLEIEVKQRALVYPGQKSRVDITVRDFKGQPVKNTDLTAFSYTSEFDIDQGGPFRFPDERKSKKIRNNFVINNKSERLNNVTALDFNKWKTLFSLDTIEYYKFLHHDEDIRFFSFTPADHITQLAPYVLKEGRPVDISYVKVDNVPVYFGWSGNIKQPYSFRVGSGYHQIEIRTRNKLFSVDSVFFSAGQKLILSINDVNISDSMLVRKVRSYPDKGELASIGRYVMPVWNRFGADLAYLVQDSNITVLNLPSSMRWDLNSDGYSQRWNSASDIFGPLRPSGATLKRPGNYNLSFNFEAGFEYDFQPSVIKMRSKDVKNIIPRYWYNPSDLNFYDLPLTESRVMSSYNEMLYHKKLESARFSLPSITLPLKGSLILKTDPATEMPGNIPTFLVMVSMEHNGRTIVYPGGCRDIRNLDPGYWRLYLFYRGNRYYSYDSIRVKSGGRNFVRLDSPGQLRYDSTGIRLNNIIENQVYNQNDQATAYFREYMRQYERQQSLTLYSGDGYIVRGNVCSSDGPLPGVTVIVKGTTVGTSTDLNGNYILKVPYNKKELVFSFIGYQSQEAAANSDIVDVRLEEEVTALSEVVVTALGRRSISGALQGRVAGVSVSSQPAIILIRGTSSLKPEYQPLILIDGAPYDGDLSRIDPSLLSGISVMNDPGLVALYGARAEHGVIMISTKGLKSEDPRLLALLKGAAFDSTYITELSEASPVRKNFRDYAFWQPELTTDRNGKASFDITFPDNITNWSTYIYAMNGRKQSGFVQGSVKAYKPLMAQVQTPGFLIAGDSAVFIGRIMNFASDTAEAEIEFEVNDSLMLNRHFHNVNSETDKLPVMAVNTDSVKVKYCFRKDDGYLDGEEKKIAVYRKGLEMTEGVFLTLNNDTIVTVKGKPSMGNGVLYAQTNLLEVAGADIDKLIFYFYGCNEQAASKLFALLAKETIYRFNDKRFTQKHLINKLINDLERNQNADGCWGWWNKSETSLWITIHVMGALMKARSAGYEVKLNESALNDYMVWKMESSLRSDDRLNLLFLLSISGGKIDYVKYIEKINESELRSIADKFRLIELKQRLGLEYSIDSVRKFEKSTIFGNLWFGDTDDSCSVSSGQVQTTLAAYRILKAGKKSSDRSLERIRNYFFEMRNTGSWKNTFETASVVETIVPDLLKKDKGGQIKPELTLSGSTNRKISEFPIRLQTRSGDSIRIEKKGTLPVYLTHYQHYWNSAPYSAPGYFLISTGFEGNTETLTSGRPVRMKISIRVLKDAEFVMAEIPIPAGCSYSSRDNNFPGASHAEFYRDHLAIFFEKIRTGSYEFEIGLLPRFTGKYTINPASVGLMYFPVFSSNNMLKEITIE